MNQVQDLPEVDVGAQLSDELMDIVAGCDGSTFIDVSFKKS